MYKTNSSKKKIIILATEFSTISIFLKDIILKLSTKYKIILVCNNINSNYNFPSTIEIRELNIKRKIYFFYDFYILVKFIFLIFKIKPQLIFSITPKAGFINGLSNLFSKSKSLHIFTGILWINKTGFFRKLFKFFDFIIFKFNNFILADSQSQISYLVDEGFVNKKITLIHHGSVSGVDIDRFIPNNLNSKNFRHINNIDDNTILIGYLGRINKDKGVCNLMVSVSHLIKLNYNIKLIIIGPDEDGILNNIKNDFPYLLNNILIFDFTNTPEKFFQVFDIFCLPSYREGFGLSLIEANSCSVPVIGSNIIGIQDSIIDNFSGFLFDPFDVNDLSSKITKLVSDKNLRSKMGSNGRLRVINYFNKNDITDFIYKLIIKITD